MLSVLGFPLAIIGLAWFLLLWRGENRRSFSLSPFAMFAGFEFVFVLPATLFAYLSGSVLELYPFVIITLAITVFLLGFTLTGALTNTSLSLPVQFQAAPTESKHPDAHYLVTMSIISLTLIAAGVYLYQGLPPLIRVIQSLDVQNLDWLQQYSSSQRLELTKGYYFGQEYRGQGIIRTVMLIGWPYVMSLSVLAYFERKHRSFLISSGIIFLLMLVFVGGDGTRAPVIFVMMVVLVSISLVRPIRWPELLGFGLLAYAVVVLLSIFSYHESLALLDSNSLLPALRRILERFFLPNALHDVATIELIQTGTLHLSRGRILANNLLNILPGVRYGNLPFQAELASRLGEGGYTTFATMTYLGETYADFGVGGTLITFSLTGVICGLAHRVLFSRSKTLFILPIIGSTSFYLAALGLRGIASTLAALAIIGVFYGLSVGLDALGDVMFKRRDVSSTANSSDPTRASPPQEIR